MFIKCALSVMLHITSLHISWSGCSAMNRKPAQLGSICLLYRAEAQSCSTSHHSTFLGVVVPPSTGSLLNLAPFVFSTELMHSLAPYHITTFLRAVVPPSIGSLLNLAPFVFCTELKHSLAPHHITPHFLEWLFHHQ